MSYLIWVGCTERTEPNANIGGTGRPNGKFTVIENYSSPDPYASTDVNRWRVGQDSCEHLSGRRYTGGLFDQLALYWAFSGSVHTIKARRLGLVNEKLNNMLYHRREGQSRKSTGKGMAVELDAEERLEDLPNVNDTTMKRKSSGNIRGEGCI